MSESPFKWSSASDLAAERLAAGKDTDCKIAKDLEIDRKTLWRWQQHPEFAARVEEHLDRFRAEVRRRGLAIREQRVSALNDRWNRLQRVVEARADDETMAHVPGGTTGLLVRTVKGIGSGDAFQVIEEYEVDAALLKELREHEKQAAQELGQWVEKAAVEQNLKAYVTESPDTIWPSDQNSDPMSLLGPPGNSGETAVPKSS